MTKNGHKKRIKIHRITHLDKFGNELLIRKINVCKTYNVYSQRNILSVDMDKVIEKFVLLTKLFPPETAQYERSSQIGDISVLECREITRDLLKAALGMVWSFNADCFQLRISIKKWNIEASKLAYECNKLNVQIQEYHGILEELPYACKKHIREQGFFLARTKFYNNMAKHGDMLQRLRSFMDTSNRVKDEINSAIVYVDHSDRMTGLLSRVYEYIRRITIKEDIKCNIEALFNPNYECCDSLHRKIMLEYKYVVDEMEIAPNADELSLNATKFLQRFRQIDKSNEIALDILESDYRDRLFPVQKWINGYIKKREAPLVEVNDPE